MGVQGELPASGGPVGLLWTQDCGLWTVVGDVRQLKEQSKDNTPLDDTRSPAAVCRFFPHHLTQLQAQQQHAQCQGRVIQSR